MQAEEKTAEKIKDISKELNALTKLVHEMREILLPKDEDFNSFIDDEAIEVGAEDIEDDGSDEDKEQDSQEIIYIGETYCSSKKRRCA